MKILKFYMDGCGPCKLLDPIVKELCDSLGVEVESVDADEDERGDTFDIDSVPTLIAVEKGQELGRVVGLRSKKYLKTWIEKHL